MDKHNSVDPENIIEELKRIIEKLKTEKRVIGNPNEKKLSNPS